MSRKSAPDDTGKNLTLPSGKWKASKKAPIRRDVVAASAYPDAAGAPEAEVEVTPKMIEARVSDKCLSETAADICGRRDFLLYFLEGFWL
jgi:hypothetical protein